MARVNHIRLEDNDVRAQEDYNGLFYELDSDTEGESTQWDFCRPLQHSGFPDQPSNPNSEKLEDTPRLEGTWGSGPLLCMAGYSSTRATGLVPAERTKLQKHCILNLHC